jgi:hypothetical protein
MGADSDPAGWAGLSRRTVGAMERRRRVRCRNRTAARLAVALEVQPASLCQGSKPAGSQRNGRGARARRGGSS